MRNRLFSSPAFRLRASRKHYAVVVAGIVVILLFCTSNLTAGDAPQWMHAQVNAPLPAHDEKTDAVLLYSERNVTVVSAEKVRTVVRQAYKILRPSGRDRGTVGVPFNFLHEKVTSMRGWCIPSSGKDYEIKDKESIEVALPKVAGAELISDLKVKLLTVPASDPGNIVGWEYETEEQPLVLQNTWVFQEEDPVRESHYNLQLPPGWEYKVAWLNYPEAKPESGAGGQSRWTVTDIKAIRKQADMPPLHGVSGQMIVSFFPPGGPGSKGFSNWQDMGRWYISLISGRQSASPEIKQKVASLTAGAKTPLDKMRAVAQFVQHEVRYVAIEMGVGGWQPHPAAEIFAHRYGDCKDKVTLMASMLREAGIESYPISINIERGSVRPDMPAHMGFNHAIMAIRLPEDSAEKSLAATLDHPKLGKLLIFDPTDELAPLGQISGGLQANYGLLVAPDGGELIEVPKLPATLNSIQRTGRLVLDATGTLRGDVKEVRVGDRAWGPRQAWRTATKETDRIKPVENTLAASLAHFQITKATAVNAEVTDLPFGWEYSLEAPVYAKNAGGLLLVRPRVLGSKGNTVMEAKEPRNFPIEFDGPAKDTDVFEIVLPAGYKVDELPPPTDLDYGFASYHSKTEVNGNVLRYTRTFEIKELSVPVNKAEEFKRFNRMIFSDERNTAVLKQVGS